MRYFLTHNNLDYFKWGKLEENQTLYTSQTNTEYFLTESELINRLNFFNIEYTNISVDIDNDDFFNNYNEDIDI